MKKFIALFALSIFMISFSCGCSKTTDKHQTPEYDQVKLDPSILSDEQRKYLEDEWLCDFDSVEYLYDDINEYLQGTGMELYNQTSGVEKNGVDYSVDDGTVYTKLTSTSSKEITYEELYAIRLEDTQMRIDDFLPYEFTFKDYGEGKYGLQLPIADKPDANLRVIYTVNGNDIHIKTPRINNHQSILYEKDTYEYMWANNGEYYPDKCVILNEMYNFETTKYIVIKLSNFSGKAQEFNDSFKIYKGSDTSGDYIKELSKVTDDTYYLGKNCMNCHRLIFPSGEITEPGTYTLVYGDNDLISTFEITQQMIDDAK